MAIIRSNWCLSFGKTLVRFPIRLSCEQIAEDSFVLARKMFSHLSNSHAIIQGCIMALGWHSYILDMLHSSSWNLSSTEEQNSGSPLISFTCQFRNQSPKLPMNLHLSFKALSPDLKAARSLPVFQWCPSEGYIWDGILRWNPHSL